MAMLNLQLEAAEKAAKFRKYAQYARGAAWGLAVFSVICIAVTAWSYYTYHLAIRADLILVSVVFFSAPTAAAFWLYEVLRRSASQSSNRALRITNKLLQARITSLTGSQCPDPGCRHCRTYTLNKRADELMAAWDAQHPPKQHDGS